MLAAGFCFVALTALVKLLGTDLHPIQTAFLRYLLGLVFFLPALKMILATRLTKRHWTLFGARGALHSVGVALWFFAMARIPLAEVTAMNYLTPVYVTLGAAVFLGEKLALRRIAAIGVAVLGAFVILRPGFREVEPAHFAMLGTTLVLGGSYLLAKITVDEIDPAVVVAQLSLWVTLALLPPAVAVWTPPSWHELGILFGVAFFATAGHYFMSHALRAAPVAVTQPVTFLQLLWATLLGAFAFGEPVDIWVVAGGTMIVMAVSFIAWREAVLKRRAITPPAMLTKL